jgi:hypothetical protein
VYAQATPLLAVAEDGSLLLEPKVPTDPDLVGQVIAGVPGRKQVLFEEGRLVASPTRPQIMQESRDRDTGNHPYEES